MGPDDIAAVELLGTRMRDEVTGTVGTVTAVAVYLYGSSRVELQPPPKGDAIAPEPRWYELARLRPFD